ncbi:MAG: AAA family ATPase [Sulfolobales archaeon]
MFIERVKIENILSHQNSVVEFKEGLNVIIGPNGAGKSTIIDSIVYALLALGRGSEEIVRTSKSNMLRGGSSRGSIELVFRIGGERYVVRREIGLKGDSTDFLKRLSPKESILAIGSSVPREIMKILSISEPKILTSTIIARQDFLNEVLLEPPSKRKERILKLLGLEKLEKARENLRKIIGEVDSKIMSIERELGRKEQLDREIKKLEKDLSILRAERDKLRTEVENSRKKVEELEKLREEISELLRVIPIAVFYENRSREYEEKKKRLKELEDKISAYEKLDLNEVAELRDRILNMRSSMKTLEEELEKRVREVERLESHAENIVKEISEKYKDEDLEKLWRERVYTRVIEVSERILRDLENSIATAKAYIEIYRNFQESFRETDRCPICGTPLSRDKIDHLIREHSTKIEEYSKKISVLTISREDLSRLVRELRDTLNRVEVENGRIRELREKRDNLERELRENLSRCSHILQQAGVEKSEDVSEDISCVKILERIYREYDALKQVFESIRRDLPLIEADLRSREKEAEEARSKVIYFARSRGFKDLEGSDLSSMESSLKKYSERILRELEEARRSYENASSRLNRIEGEISRSENDLRIKKEEISKLKDLESEVHVLKKARDSLEKLSEIFRKDGVIAKILTSRVRASLESEINRILRETNREFRMKIDEEFGFGIVYSSGVERPIENLSGGEKTILSIALRLALARILTGRIPRFMILDEPTQNLDSDMRIMIFDIIREIAGAMDQVIVVTHDEEIADRADRLIRVINTGGVSRINIER